MKTPRKLQLQRFSVTCECGHVIRVDEQTDHAIFDPSTGRVACPRCLATYLAMLVLSPDPDDATGSA